MSKPDYSTLQKMVDKHMADGKAAGWPYFPPPAVLLQLFEELGEIARVLNWRYGDQIRKPDEKDRSLDLEMGGFLMALICLFNPMGLNLAEMMRQTRMAVRKQPACRQSPLKLFFALGRATNTLADNVQVYSRNLPLATVGLLLLALEALAEREKVDLTQALPDYLAHIAERDARRYAK